MSISSLPFPESEYTPETHPWRGQMFIAWPPGVYMIDGRSYCKESWILAHHPKHQNKNISVFNSLEQCAARVTECGGDLMVFNPQDRKAIDNLQQTSSK